MPQQRRGEQTLDTTFNFHHLVDLLNEVDAGKTLICGAENCSCPDGRVRSMPGRDYS